MTSDFLSKGRIEQEMKEDFGSAWNILDRDAKEQLIVKRKEKLLTKYEELGTMFEAVRDIRGGQSQMYLGIILGLSGGLLGSVVDGWLGGNLLYDIGVFVTFVAFIVTFHFAHDSVIKEISSFTLSRHNKRIKEEGELSK